MPPDQGAEQEIMNPAIHDDRLFEDSLSVLALAAMQNSAAEGFAYFRTAEAGRPTLLRIRDVCR